ncbi:MAG: glycerophosphodiester phosphodiesterase family protein [Phycisphaerae bacterium]|nr:glycerophosphodiester phosphodiesterase family protein [Phycisphaerae bacterium]
MVVIRESARAALAFLIASVATISVCVLPVRAEEEAGLFQPIRPPRPVQVIAHRGVTSAAPENTRAAYELAVGIGADWVEIDIRPTKDGHHVILHDSKLDRTTNGKGPVKDRTLEEIRALDAGSWFAPRFANQRVPTFPQVLAWAKGKINLYLDCKGVNAEQLVREVLDAGMERQVVVFDSRADAEKIRRLSGGKIPIMPDYTKEVPLDDWFKPSRPAALEVDADLLSAELVKRARAEGVFIQTDALGPLLDTPAGWRKLIAGGVNWIQSDRADGVLGMFYRQGARKRKRIVIGDHRGAAQLAPENTLAAFKKSIELGMDMTELDLRTTADGELVVIHDPMVDRTTDGKGEVRGMTLAELRKLNAGRWFGPRFALERIPTFKEVLLLCKGKIRVKVHVKQADPAKLVAELRECGMADDHVIILEGPPYLKRVVEIEPKIPVKTWFRKDQHLDYILEHVKPEALEISWDRVTKERVALCHQHGIKAFTCTPGEALAPAEYAAMMKTGVDIIQTDYPLLLARAVELSVMASK